MEHYSQVAFGAEFPGEEGSEMVHCLAPTASSFVAKVWSDVFAHFHAVPVKRLGSMRT
jgi:hypothetical protein